MSWGRENQEVKEEIENKTLITEDENPKKLH